MFNFSHSAILSRSHALKVPGEGFEPSRPIGHMPLKHACLPISAPGRVGRKDTQVAK